MPPIRSARAPVAPPRRPRCQLDAYMRTKLVELKTVAGWTYEQIHKEYPSIPIGTIKTTVYRANKRVKNETSPRSGRPRKLDADDKTKLLDRLRHIRSVGFHFHIRSANCGFADPTSTSASAVRTSTEVRKNPRMSC